MILVELTTKRQNMAATTSKKVVERLFWNGKGETTPHKLFYLQEFRYKENGTDKQ